MSGPTLLCGTRPTSRRRWPSYPTGGAVSSYGRDMFSTPTTRCATRPEGCVEAARSEAAPCASPLRPRASAARQPLVVRRRLGGAAYGATDQRLARQVEGFENLGLQQPCAARAFQEVRDLH